MSDPKLNQIEQGLRAMTEPRTESGTKQSDGSTELWKRALEISRAEERAGLVHPGADRAERPRGRRMLIALNAVGVAAMVLLAAGVWTIMQKPTPGNNMGIGTESSAEGFSPAASELADSGPSLFESQRQTDQSSESALTDQAFEDQTLAMADESDDLAFGEMGAALSRSAEMPADAEPKQLADLEPAADSLARSRASREIAAGSEAGTDGARLLKSDATVAVDDSHPGISQMRMAPEAGLALEDADASVMAFDPYLVNADIVIEVSDVTAAFNALSELPRAEFDEFSMVVPDEANKDAEPIDELVLNMAPARFNQALGEIRGMGKVVEERREIDTPARRAGAAIDWALVNTAPSAAALQTVIDAQGLTAHERAHRHLPVDEAEQLEAVRDAFNQIVQQLEVTRRSMNLSRINVSIRQAPESDIIEE